MMNEKVLNAHKILDQYADKSGTFKVIKEGMDELQKIAIDKDEEIQALGQQVTELMLGGM